MFIILFTQFLVLFVVGMAEPCIIKENFLFNKKLMPNLTPKKRRVKEKSPEIERFKEFMRSNDLKDVDIYKETGISTRTINNFIWEDKPIGGHLLRELHSKFNVSLDWLLAGIGEMMLGKSGNVRESTAHYAVNQGMNERARRMHLFIDHFMSAASDDEQVWLEMQLKIHVPQYLKFLEQQHEQ